FESNNPAVKVDPNTGAITVDVPADAKPGDVIEAVVTVTYPDGSSDQVIIKIPVAEKDQTDAGKNDPKFEEKSGKPGETVEIPAPKNADGSELPAGSKFESNNPAVKVDPNTGAITVDVPADAKPGDVIEAVVTVTYPDGSTDKVPVTVKVVDPTTDAGKNDPKFEEKSGKPGETVEIPAPKNADGSELPAGSKFESNNPAVKVDPNTGAITVDVPADAKPGDVIEAVVTVTYPDGSSDQVTIKIPVAEKDQTDAGKNDPKFEEKSGKPGETVEIPAPKNADGSELPAGSKFESNNPAVKVDPNTGAITVDVPADAKPGDVIEAVVTVTYPDGSSDQVTIKIPVAEKDQTDAGKNDPKFEEKSGKPGETVKIPAPKNADGSELPAGSKFESNNPAVKVDPNTGAITVDVPADAKPGDVIEAVVTVTYPDGSSDQVTIKIPVAEKDQTDADKNTPVAQDQTVKPGEAVDPSKSISNLSDLPEGTKVAFETPVDTSTAGDKVATVVVTYPDGSQDKLQVLVKVVLPDNDTRPNSMGESTTGVGLSKDGQVAASMDSVSQVPIYNQENLPNTGEETDAGAVALGLGMLLSAVGLKARRRREED
ncbi:YPDG domain-containing protein, partial [Streptococcus sp. 10F2]